MLLPPIKTVTGPCFSNNFNRLFPFRIHLLSLPRQPRELLSHRNAEVFPRFPVPRPMSGSYFSSTLIFGDFPGFTWFFCMEDSWRNKMAGVYYFSCKFESFSFFFFSSRTHAGNTSQGWILAWRTAFTNGRRGVIREFHKETKW